MADHQFLSVPGKSLLRKPPEQATPISNDGDHLQNVIGNQAMQRLLTNTPAKPPLFIQAKLTVGAANDPYEAEADSVADRVMKMPDKVQREGDEEQLAAKRDFSAIQRDEGGESEDEEVAMKRDFGAIQRDEGGESEDEEVAMKRDFGAIQRDEGGESEDEEVAMKRDFGAIQRADVDKMGSFDVDENVEQQISSMKGGGQPLPETARDFFEPRFGQDFSDVRVHTGAESDKVNREISARAFTNGNDIFVRSNEYSPDTNDGRTLLAHELTHVVQQTGGKAQTKRDDQS